MALISRCEGDAKDVTAFKNLMISGEIGQAGAAFPTIVLPTPPPAVLPGILARLRAVVRRIKSAPGYTENIGQDLGIVRTKAAIAANTKPTGSVRALPDSVVEIKFVKNGAAGVCIESKRGADTTWDFLSNALRSPWTDERPPVAPGMPEVRQYRLLTLKGNDTLGEPSDTMIVATMP